MRLKALVVAGHHTKYAERLKATFEALPDENCGICGGGGKRAEVPRVGPGPLPCNGCNATGKVRPMETHYPFRPDMLEEFVTFLENCGGFEIH